MTSRLPSPSQTAAALCAGLAMGFLAALVAPSVYYLTTAHSASAAHCAARSAQYIDDPLRWIEQCGLEAYWNLDD